MSDSMDEEIKEAFRDAVGGFCVSKNDRHWTFIWNGEYLSVECADFGWVLNTWEGRMVFDELFAALDYWDTEHYRNKREYKV